MDLSEFEAHIVLNGPRCGVGKVLARLGAKDRAKLEAALKATHLPNTAIARWGKGKGEHLTAEMVGRHRKGECGCERT